MNADNKMASIGIEIMHKDVGLQALYFEQFMQLKPALQEALEEEWIWLPHTPDEHGKTTSCIFTSLQNRSVLERSDWPQLISFFKPRMIALDQFWSSAKYWFEALQ